MPTPPNATRADIIAMLQDGHSNSRIMRELRCDKQRVRRIRAELDLPKFVPAEQTRTVEDKWRLFAKPVDGGHIEWTGERAKGNGTPVMRYKEQSCSPAAVAFEMRHGRPPQGYVRAECGMQHCVAPDHVNDEAGRQHVRRALRAERGLGDVPAKCISGHDLAEHAKFEPDGTAYCGRCKVLDKQAQRDPSVSRQMRPRSASLEEAFHAHTEPAHGGHVRWTGSMSHATPAVWFRGSTYSAYRVAFRVHHGREPEGQVRPACGVLLCVAGAHVEDRPMRQRTAALYAAIFEVAS
jgi:hypothetical protein